MTFSVPSPKRRAIRGHRSDTRITTTAIPGFPVGDNVAITGGFVQASNAKNPLPGVPEIRSSLVSPEYEITLRRDSVLRGSR